MDMGGAAKILKIKKKTKKTKHRYKFYQIKYFDYYNISISFVHWYILNWKYENCYTELCRVQNFCILASTMTLVLKFLIPIIALFFFDPPFLNHKMIPSWFAHPPPTRVFMNTPIKEVM